MSKHCLAILFSGRDSRCIQNFIILISDVQLQRKSSSFITSYHIRCSFIKAKKKFVELCIHGKLLEQYE